MNKRHAHTFHKLLHPSPVSFVPDTIAFLRQWHLLAPLNAHVVSSGTVTNTRTPPDCMSFKMTTVTSDLLSKPQIFSYTTLNVETSFYCQVTNLGAVILPNGLWSMEMLQKYICWVRTTLQPIMMADAERILLAYYQFVRQDGRHSASRVTIRMLESLVRIAQVGVLILCNTQNRGPILLCCAPERCQPLMGCGLGHQ